MGGLGEDWREVVVLVECIRVGVEAARRNGCRDRCWWWIVGDSYVIDCVVEGVVVMLMVVVERIIMTMLEGWLR